MSNVDCSGVFLGFETKEVQCVCEFLYLLMYLEYICVFLALCSHLKINVFLLAIYHVQNNVVNSSDNLLKETP